MQSLLPYFIISAYFLFLAFVLGRYVPFCRHIAKGNTAHYRSIDGLRGFLAPGVFFHHSVIAYYQQKTGIWSIPPIGFYTIIGQMGLYLFFMITGFLFWEKTMVQREFFFHPIRFYFSRLKRLAPAYLFSIVLVLAAMALPIGDHSFSQLQWQDLRGVLMFGGVGSAGYINAIYWTLVWEWYFYLLLPLLAIFASGYRTLLPITAAIGFIIYEEMSGGSSVLIFDFLCGAVTAIIVQKYDLRQYLARPIYGLLALAPLVGLFLCFDSGYGYAQSLLLWAFFMCIVYGNSLFGLLHSRPALLLGTISYSIYLLHCIIIYIVVQCVNVYLPVLSLSELEYWSLVPVQGVIVILLALFSYRFCEHPFIKSRHS